MYTVFYHVICKPFNINMIQVYAPTQDYDDENIEEFYEQIQLAVSYTKSSDIICIMGDLNAKVGNVTDFNITGNYGLGKQNERGQRLIEFCNENNMVIMKYMVPTTTMQTVHMEKPRRYQQKPNRLPYDQ